ncbi:MAG: ATP-binding protein [Eggerthellaceae bacterium]|nr:ATP-binding protein [Eggerthellaceae bacterium]
MSGNNPFTPVFGKVPPYMAGRQDVIGPITQALEEGSNSPDIATLLVGPRGSGKTALLSYLAVEAQGRGWVAANVTASRGMLDDVVQQCREGASHLLEEKDGSRLTGIQLGSVSLQWERGVQNPPNWRSLMNGITDELAKTDTGLLITVDEVDPRLEEMRHLVEVYQHFMRENRKVALVMAGLPHNVSLMVSKYTTTFLRRAARHTLGPVPDYEIAEAFRLTVLQGGREIEPDALAAATEAIQGFPFMFQLVGYRAWNASPGERGVSIDDVRAGIVMAKAELKSRVFDATLSTLANGDIAFLAAMLEDEGDTLQSDMARRLNKSSSHVSTYKRRLLDEGVIEEPRRGRLRFCLPGFREFLLEEGV